jgi:hypothetical protein
MATKSSEITQKIYQLKVTLLGTDPPIWRRVLVPAAMTLAKLHNVLQIAMGWGDEHMHEFRAGQRRFGRPEPAEPFMRMSRVESERTVALAAVLQRVGAKMIYTYDFGDSWEHALLFEKQFVADPHTTYPVCTDGQFACPPEDCGGIPGYYDLLDALAIPATHATKNSATRSVASLIPKGFPSMKSIVSSHPLAVVAKPPSADPLPHAKLTQSLTRVKRDSEDAYI